MQQEPQQPPHLPAAAGPIVTSNENESEAMHRRFQKEYYLRRGAGSVVFLGKDLSNGTNVVIKRLDSCDPLNSTTILNEINVFKRIDSHPSLVRFHGAYRLNRYCHFVMDHLIGGDLRQLIRHQGSLSQQSIAYLVACLGSALNHLHRHRIIHRDVKPENVGFDDRARPYLFDFGISFTMTEARETFVCSNSSGTLAYLAPEVLTSTHRHSYQSDFWSLGIIAYELVYHQKPHFPHVPKSYISYCVNHYDFVTHDPSSPSLALEITSGHEEHPNAVSAAPTYSDNLISLLPDHSLPLYLEHSYPVTRVPFPHPPSSLDLVKREMIQLLSGLLELRIPFRLGAIDRFDQFTRQAIFLIHGYHDLSRLPSLASPLFLETSLGPFRFGNTNQLIPVDLSQEEEASLVVPDETTSSTTLEKNLEGLFPYFPTSHPMTATPFESVDYLDPHRLSQPQDSQPLSLSSSISSDGNETERAELTPSNLMPIFSPSPGPFHHLI